MLASFEDDAGSARYLITDRQCQGELIILLLLFSLVVVDGVGHRTWAAVVGMVATMLAVGLLSAWAIRFTHLTGSS